MKFGIDISSWQNVNDYNEVLNDVDFVILRVGYGVTYMPNEQKDKKFDQFYDNLKGKCPLGAYYYAYGTSYETGVKEAENYLAYIGDRNFELPIYYDMEENRNTKEAGQGFVDRIRQAGFKAGIYASSSFYRNKGLENINCDSVWIAQYGSNNGNKPNDVPTIKHDIWQYSSKGNISGINGSIDINEAEDYLFENQVIPEHKPQYVFEQFTLDYQKAYNKVYGAKYGMLIEDGLRGPATKDSMKHVCLAKGSKNELVKWCQDRLKNHKGYDIKIDGIFGGQTKGAVNQFQLDNNLVDDGIIGKNTISILF